MKKISCTSKNVQVGYQVLILAPLYVTEKLGIVCGRELNLDSEHKQRWIIRVESENILMSLTEDEFHVIIVEQC